MGTPHGNEWDGVEQLPFYQANFPQWPPRRLSAYLPHLSSEGVSLVERMLEYNPKKRISAFTALHHPYICPIYSPQAIGEDEDDFLTPTENNMASGRQSARRVTPEDGVHNVDDDDDSSQSVPQAAQAGVVTAVRENPEDNTATTSAQGNSVVEEMKVNMSQQLDKEAEGVGRSLPISTTSAATISAELAAQVNVEEPNVPCRRSARLRRSTMSSTENGMEPAQKRVKTKEDATILDEPKPDRRKTRSSRNSNE